jgi:hypothetical protein
MFSVELYLYKLILVFADNTGSFLQWTQENSEFGLHYSKTRREDEKSKKVQEDKRACLSIYTTTKNIFSPLNFDTISSILICWLLYYSVFCEPKEL